MKHEYFDRKQAYYFIDRESNSIKKHKIKKTFKNIIFELIKNTGFLISHLKNHHIVLAKKIKDIDEVVKNRKITNSVEEWNQIRKNTINY